MLINRDFRAIYRENGQDRRGHGPDKRGHEGSGEKSEWLGKMLRDMRAALQQVGILHRVHIAAIIIVLLGAGRDQNKHLRTHRPLAPAAAETCDDSRLERKRQIPRRLVRVLSFCRGLGKMYVHE